jgi:hypothetical protein
MGWIVGLVREMVGMVGGLEYMVIRRAPFGFGAKKFDAHCFWRHFYSYIILTMHCLTLLNLATVRLGLKVSW